MKQKFLFTGTLALLLTTASFSVHAGRDYSTFFGAAAESSSANRTITIGPDTSYVNVTGGDIVKFVYGDKTFTWNFDVDRNMWEIDLNKLAPPGAFTHLVKVYIKHNPIYDGGG